MKLCRLCFLTIWTLCGRSDERKVQFGEYGPPDNPNSLKEKGECIKMRIVPYHQLEDTCFKDLAASSDKKAIGQGGCRRMPWGGSIRVKKVKKNKRCNRNPKTDG